MTIKVALKLAVAVWEVETSQRPSDTPTNGHPPLVP